MSAVRITLSRDGEHFTIIDEAALELVRRYRWSLHHCGKGKLYARAQRDPDTGEPLRLYLHRLIAAHFLPLPPTPKHTHVDHGRGGSLDNRAQNLKWEIPVINRWGTARWVTKQHALEEQPELIPF